MSEELKIKTTSQRNIGLDLTRILAFLSVVSVHFFLNTDFYKIPIKGKRMLVLATLRTSFMVCVPLFLLLTGYLVSYKKISLEAESLKKYYKKIIPVLLSYVLAMGLVFVILRLRGDGSYNLQKVIFGILGYKEYSWYVNMYIGLFLLSPFLANIWTSIGDKKTHLILISVFSVLTIGPTVFNIHDLTSLKSIFAAYDDNKINHILPGWWFNLFPLTYFFLGAYLRTYVNFKKLRPAKVLLALVLIIFVSSAYNIWRSHGGVFQTRLWNSWGSLQNTASSVAFFIFINSISPTNIGEISQKILAYLSKLTFSAYIISAATDKIIYIYLRENVGGVKEVMAYMPAIVLTSAILALILAGLVEYIKGKILEKCYR
ncbi:acyltransferase family protein [uncultured Anaerococcus sp.]|uniref:acyltransferase n=1 Tax=uncultured Anaerococcus sp. TaxID=293428 RepID=UPI0028890AD3|nr:acyltransferase family protein [uncultured Anaerococcus sp.]